MTDPIPYESVAPEHREVYEARLEAVMPGVDPVAHWAAMGAAHQHEWLYLVERPDEARGQYAAEVARLDARYDADTQRAWESLVRPDDWPVLDAAALLGIAGEIVAAIEPHTEADRPALLMNTLTMAGASIGRSPHAWADGSEHPARLWCLLVGDTAKARKGTSYKQVRRVVAVADPGFVKDRILGGFASGEAVIDAVSTEAGDHRLLVVEPEYARLLAVCRREGSTLSPIMRDAWDGERLQVRTRNRTHGTAVADGAHVSMIGHITIEELRAKLDETEQANGYANRHLFALTKRAQLLPSGGLMGSKDIDRLGKRLRDVLEAARKIGTVRRSDAAEQVWAELYARLADEDTGGMLGALTARSEAQCLRLSVLYALLDGTRAIEPEHIRAAEAVWDYCAQSVRVIFGASLGDSVADKLLAAIVAAGAGGIDLTARYRLFSGNLPAARLDTATDRLLREGRIFRRTEESDTGGRPRTVLVPSNTHNRHNALDALDALTHCRNRT
jgi:hypothetical protein